MKCKYGNQNMYLNEDECIWHCSHCGYEKFAIRSFYNAMKKEAKNYSTKNKFIAAYDKSVSEIISKAWDKYYAPKNPTTK